MSDKQELSEQLKLMIDKSARSLAVAHRLSQENDYDFASSRAYYAAFYGLQAILLTKNLSASKHSGTIRLFNEHFIKTGIFPKAFNKFINQLFRDRQTGDYTLRLTPQLIKSAHRTAETMLQAIIKYLKDESFLENA